MIMRRPRDTLFRRGAAGAAAGGGARALYRALSAARCSLFDSSVSVAGAGSQRWRGALESEQTQTGPHATGTRRHRPHRGIRAGSYIEAGRRGV